MSAKLIIVSNGESTAILLNDIFLKSAGRAAFTASGGLDADFSVDISLSTPDGIWSGERKERNLVEEPEGAQGTRAEEDNQRYKKAANR